MLWARGCHLNSNWWLSSTCASTCQQRASTTDMSRAHLQRKAGFILGHHGARGFTVCGLWCAF
eukprot:1469303-Amphidinium_carterae.1